MENGLVKFTEEKKQLIKDTICKGATDTEFSLFLHTCQRLNLDPIIKHIYAVKRWNSSLGREEMAIQIGVDGYRILAERTGQYAPGREPTFTYREGSHIPVSATAYVRKRTSDGTWHEVSSTAFYDEYVARKKDGSVMGLWSTKPHIMLAKCAETATLRRAFPMDFGGSYGTTEIPIQVEGDDEDDAVDITPVKSTINQKQLEALLVLVDRNEAFVQRLLTAYKISGLEQLPESAFKYVLEKAQAEHYAIESGAI